LNRIGLVSLIVPLLIFLLPVLSLADSSLPRSKQTVLGKYLTAKEAHEKYSADPGSVHILDVRTIGEYVFVGHAPMAVNIPVRFLSPGTTVRNKPVMPPNKNFVEEVEKKYKKTDTILVMCRSGGRSAKAVNMLAEAGFSDVYTITDGFEGDADKNGDRTRNGWKNSGAPWTYKLDPELVYNP
jgi:rhodanese-related sulfurtransferase